MVSFGAIVILLSYQLINSYTSSFPCIRQSKLVRNYIRQQSIIKRYSTSKVIEITNTEKDDELSGRDEIFDLLQNIIDPDSGNGIVSLGYVANLRISENNEVSFSLLLPKSYADVVDDLIESCKTSLSKLSWIREITIVPSIQSNTETYIPPQKVGGMSGVKHIIAVSSCKGGVGKSTVSVNLAYTLQQAGASVGILDADIYGPSLPTMTRPDTTEVVFRTNQIYPLEYEGVKLMSMGFINKGAAIMRGPMVNQVLNQFVSLTQWGDLDYLIVDMPPGTGDIQLTLAQIMNISAAVIVTTPQRLSFVDVVKGIDLFDTVNVPCVAVVENMAEYLTYSFPPDFYSKLGAKAASVAAAATALTSDPSKAFDAVTVCIKDAIQSQCQGRRLFGEGHLSRLREMWGIENLIALPLLDEVATSGDTGRPFVLLYPDSDIASAMAELADGVVKEIDRLSKSQAASNTLVFNKTSNVLIYENFEITPAALRRDCRCAVCVEEFTGRALLNPETVSEDIKPLALAPIGRYAVSVDWSDGHKSLFPFKQISLLARQKKKA